MHRFNTVGIAALVGIMWIAPPAAAEISAAARVSGIGWTLFDMSPMDGFAPRIDFAVGTQINFARSEIFTTDAFDSHAIPYQLANAFSSAFLSTARESQSGTLSNGRVDTLVVSASGSTRNVMQEQSSEFFALAASNDWTFTVSPNTLVAFYANVDVEAKITGIGYEYTYAQGELNVSNIPCFTCGPSTSPVAGLTGSQNSNATESVELESFGPGSMASAKLLRVAFINGSSTEQVGYLSANSSVSGISNVTAVAEPESWLLLACGLMTIGVVTRRRDKSFSFVAE